MLNKLLLNLTICNTLALCSLQTAGEPNTYIAPQDLYRWDLTVSQVMEKKPLPERGRDRLYAYLFHAQKKFGDEIFAQEGAYSGSLDPISLQVIRLFYPDYNEDIRENQQASKIDGNLLADIKQRFKEEQSQIHPLALHEEKESWHGEVPYHGVSVPTWKPWFLSSPREFRLLAPPAPSDPFWQSQLAEVKRQMAQATESRKQRILFWAGMQGSPSGDWIAIIDQYMQKVNTPLAKQLKVRELIGKTIVDATIAAFDTKYTYLVRRPNMLDPQLKTYIPTPNHPSFPSAHSTIAAAIVEVLNYYFPENCHEWNMLKEESGMSRIWAGIHFPIDHQGGKILGAKVGQTALQRSGK